MDSKEKNQNDPVNADQIANSLRVDAKKRQQANISKNNRLWLWLGILVLIAILLYCLFSIGLFGGLQNAAN